MYNYALAKDKIPFTSYKTAYQSKGYMHKAKEIDQNEKWDQAYFIQNSPERKTQTNNCNLNYKDIGYGILIRTPNK